MTKHFNKPNTYADTPLAISEEYTKPDTIDYMCPYCQVTLTKINEDEYYCKKCAISQYPEQEDVRSKSKITTPLGLNLEPCLSYLEDPNESFFKDKKPEPKGGLKALKDKGIKVTSYKEGFD